MTTEENDCDRAPADEEPAPFSVPVTFGLSEAKEVLRLAKDRVSFAYAKGRDASARQAAARRGIQKLSAAIKAAERRLL